MVWPFVFIAIMSVGNLCIVVTASATKGKGPNDDPPSALIACASMIIVAIALGAMAYAQLHYQFVP